MKSRRTLVPAVIALIGMLLLMGCIPVPSTHLFMVNNNLKPSWKIGNSSNKPIWLGHTTITEAVNFLNHYLVGTWDSGAIPWGGGMGRTLYEVGESWKTISDDQFAVPFRIRDVFLFMPLCATVLPGHSQYDLVLQTDSSDHVIDYQILPEDEFQQKYARSARSGLPQRIHWEPTLTVSRAPTTR